MAGINYSLTDMLDFTDVIHIPLSARIRYTCFDASANYLVFGATSGSIYIFTLTSASEGHSDRLSLLQIVPSKFGLINQVAISKQEKLIAFSNAKGKVGFLELVAPNPQIVVAQIDDCPTVLHWLEDDKKLYLGDVKGNVSIVLLSYFMVRNSPTVAVHKILLLDTAIVQISSHEDYLLVSTYSKSVLCNTEKEEFKQIGNRPRDGNYGACFANHEPFRIFCARPGYRIWEVDHDGNVLHTAQLKAALSVNPTNILNFKTDRIPNTNNNQQASPKKSSGTVNKQQRQFTKLYRICVNYLLTHNENSFYIIDPTTSSILLWNNQFVNIESVKVTGDNMLYVFTKTNNVFRLRILPIEQEIFAQLYAGKFVEAATLIRDHLSYFEEKSKNFTEKERLTLTRMRQALEDLEGEYTHLLDDLATLLDQIRCDGNKEIALPASQMENGIYILENNVYKKPSPTNNNRHVSDPAEVLDGKSVLGHLDKNLKDALISVVRGSYGKNINQFMNFQPVGNDTENERMPPFKPRNFDVDLLNETTPIVSVKRVPNILIDASNITNGISEEEKNVRDLYLIYRSSQISNLNFFDRYAAIFDEFDMETIIRLLRGLEQIMLKNGDTDAQKNCTKIFFDYLRPELIWELEEAERQFIRNGFILLNATANLSIICKNCKFPVKSSDTCLYPEIGSVLLQFYWSRQDTETSWQLARAIPFLLQQTLKFYSQKTNENQSKLVALAINLGKQGLFNKAVEGFDADAWQDAFTYFHRTLVQKTIQCFFCDELTEVDDNFFEGERLFYTWSRFLENAVDFLDTRFLFDLLKLYSPVIPKDEISRQLYLKCLANA